jgi:hypothetical protein
MIKPAAHCRAESGPRLQCKAWRPTTRGRQTNWLGHGVTTLSNRGGGPQRGSGARAGRTHGVVTAQWPRARRQGGAAGPRAPTDKVSQKRQHEHREGGGNAPDEVAVVRAHPSSGSTCGGGAEAAWRCPTVMEALVVGSCSTGEDSNCETRPK